MCVFCVLQVCCFVLFCLLLDFLFSFFLSFVLSLFLCFFVIYLLPFSNLTTQWTQFYQRLYRLYWYLQTDRASCVVVYINFHAYIHGSSTLSWAHTSPHLSRRSAYDGGELAVA